MKKLIACLFGLLFSVPSMAAETLCNLVQFNETRINDNTWAAADKSHGFEVCANVYSAHVGSTPLSNCNAFGAFVPARVNESVSINFFNYNPYFGRTFYCEVTADGKCNTEPVQYATGNAWVTHTMTLTQSDSIGFIIEWHISGDQTRNYTAENYTVVKGSTAPTEYIPYDASCGLCPAGQVLQTYTSATGTVTQNGTPTPTNPIEPTFYTQGNMVLRKIANYADSYDASTGKITRRVGVKIFDGTEALTIYSDYYIKSDAADVVFVVSDALQNNHSVSNAFVYNTNSIWHLAGYPNKWVFNPMNGDQQLHVNIANDVLGITDYTQETRDSVIAKAKAFFKRMYDAGTPVTMYYPLKTEVEENWAETSYCLSPIKIATTKYNTNAFSGVVTALNNAVDTIKTVVSNTINQATAVANLQSGKQQRPDESCPAGKTCLLVEDMNGDPHWYEIVESYVAPTTLPDGYTELAYLESTGTQYIDTGVTISGTDSVEYSTNFAVSDTSYFSQDMQVCGAYSGNRMYLFGWYQSNFIATEHSGSYDANKTAHISVSGINANVFYPVHVSIGNGNATLTVNGVSNVNTNQTTAFENNRSLFLFARNSNGNAATFAKVRLKETTIRKNGVTVIDFVPARRESDGVLGMYDLADNNPATAFHTNAGTGTFTAGPVVLPAGFTTLQYIQSDGTQYIDTGYPVNNNVSFNAKIRRTSGESANNTIFGYRSVESPSASGNMRFFFAYANGTVGLRTGIAATNSTRKIELDTDYVVDYSLTSIKVNNETWVTSDSYYSTSDFSNGYIFNANATGYADYDIKPFVGRIYYAQIYDGNTLVRNFVPAQNGSGVLGMFDLVTGDFYTDVNGGNFTAGPVAQ